MAALHDYSKWDVIDDADTTDDDAPLIAPPAAAKSAAKPSPLRTVKATMRPPVGAAAAAAAAAAAGAEDALACALGLEHDRVSSVATIADELGMAKVRGFDDLQGALVEMGAGGQAAVLPLVVEGPPDRAAVGKVREAYDRRAHGAEGDFDRNKSARAAAETLARAEAKRMLRLARGLLATPHGVDELYDTGSFRKPGPGEAPFRVVAKKLEECETRLAAKFLRAAVEGEVRRSATGDVVRHPPYETVLARTAFKLEKGADAAAALARDGCFVLDGVLGADDLKLLYDHGSAALARGALVAADAPGNASFEAALSSALGLPTLAAFDPEHFRGLAACPPDDETKMAFRAAASVLVGVAHEIEAKLPGRLKGKLTVPETAALTAFLPQVGSHGEHEDWCSYDAADDRELSAHLFLQPPDWTRDDDGCLVVADAAGTKKRILPKGGRLVVYLSRLCSAETTPSRRRPRLALRCFFGRRDPDVALEGGDSSDGDSTDSEDDDDLANTPERRAADLAAKLRGTRGDAAFSTEVDGALPTYTEDQWRDIDLTGGDVGASPGAGAGLV